MSSPEHDPVADIIRASISAKQALLEDVGLLREIEEVAAQLAAVFQRGNKLLLAGNGGSAADAQHIASEFVGQLDGDRPGFPAIALTTDSSALTSIANDYGFDHVFRRQVETLGVTGDVLLAISTSGNSANIHSALEAARERGMLKVGMTGASGGAMRALCDVCLCVPSDNTARIQESHILLGHILCALVQRQVYPEIFAS